MRSSQLFRSSPSRGVPGQPAFCNRPPHASAGWHSKQPDSHPSTMCAGVGKWGGDQSSYCRGTWAPAVLCLHLPHPWDLGCSPVSQHRERERGGLCRAGCAGPSWRWHTSLYSYPVDQTREDTQPSGRLQNVDSAGPAGRGENRGAPRAREPPCDRRLSREGFFIPVLRKRRFPPAAIITSPSLFISIVASSHPYLCFVGSLEGKSIQASLGSFSQVRS